MSLETDQYGEGKSRWLSMRRTYGISNDWLAKLPFTRDDPQEKAGAKALRSGKGGGYDCVGKRRCWRKVSDGGGQMHNAPRQLTS